MDRQQLLILGLVVSAIGCLTILLNWLEMDFKSTYVNLSFDYTGISLITSGDFTDPDGLFYNADIGKLGVYTPTLICIAFAAIALRFLVKVDGRPYMKDVAITVILIIIGSIYMIYWVGPGSYYYDYSAVETHGFGTGPFVSIFLAVVCGVIASAIDNAGTDHTDAVSHTTSAPYVADSGLTEPSTRSGSLFCPYCGENLSGQGQNTLRFCSHCGANLEQIPRNDK